MCREPESNWRHQVFQTCALPTELSRRATFKSLSAPVTREASATRVTDEAISRTPNRRLRDTGRISLFVQSGALAFTRTGVDVTTARLDAFRALVRAKRCHRESTGSGQTVRNRAARLLGRHLATGKQELQRSANVSDVMLLAWITCNGPATAAPLSGVGNAMGGRRRPVDLFLRTSGQGRRRRLRSFKRLFFR